MIPAGAERLVDQAGVTAAYDRLGRSLNQALPEGEILMLPVMNGGIFAVCELARRIDRPMRFDYVHATRYRGETRGREVQWLHWPSLPAHPGSIVLIDDIFDEGHTLAAIRERLPAPERVVTVALVRKLHDRGLPRGWIDHYGIDVPDRYVFGCGMDYQENLRELPEIWALAP